jgi:hypothetical protein
LRGKTETMRHLRDNIPWALCFAAMILMGGCGWFSILPPPGLVKGWTYAAPPESFDPETLYEYIDGKARAYLDYGFVRLDHVQFSPSTQPDLLIDVDLYDMGSPVGAFGIYSLERGDDLPLHYRKRLGYRVGSNRFFWKGRYYAVIASPDSSRQTIEAVLAISSFVEASLPAAPDGIPLLAAFPQEGKVPESEQYFAVNLMGHEFMGAGFLAAYQEKGNRFKLFISPKESSAASTTAYESLKAALSESGEFIAEEGGLGESAFLAQDAYLGKWLVFITGDYVAGAVSFDDLSFARRLLTTLCHNLRSAAGLSDTNL